MIMNMKEVRRGDSSSHLLTRAGARFILHPPPLGHAPVRIQPELMARVLPSSIARAAVMLRANAYFSAGCSLDLCEYAAARDLWFHRCCP
jgi:hypothetical protein